jgi:hypothetical protein
MAGELKEWFEDEVQIVPDEALKAALAGPSYSHDSSRRLKVESKEHMKARGLKSPDGFDMMCLTHAVPVAKGVPSRKRPNRTHDQTNWRAL